MKKKIILVEVILAVFLMLLMPLISNIPAQTTEKIQEEKETSINKDPLNLPISIVSGKYKELTMEECNSNGISFHLKGTGISEGYRWDNLKFWTLFPIPISISTNENWVGNIYSNFEIKHFIGNINHEENRLVGIGFNCRLTGRHDN